MPHGSAVGFINRAREEAGEAVGAVAGAFDDDEEQQTSQQREQTRQRVRQQSPLERGQTAVEAFIPDPDIPGVDVPGIDAEDLPGVERGRRAREEVRAVAEETEGAAGTALDFLGPPQTGVGAGAEAALTAVPFARPGARVGGRLLGRAGAREAGEEVAQAAGRGAAREASEEAAQATGRRAAREASEEATETTVSRSLGEATEETPRVFREGAQTTTGGPGTRRAAREATEEVSQRRVSREAGQETTEQAGQRATAREAGEEAAEEGTGALARSRRFVRDRPLTAAGGAALGGAAIAGLFRDDNEGFDDGGRQPPDDREPDPLASEGDPGPATRPPHGADGAGLPPGGPGQGPFASTGAGPLSLGFLDRIGGGLGGALDRIGGGIADTLRGLGIPIGEGAGKAIAIGGTIVLIGFAINQVLSGTAGAGGLPNLGPSSTPPRGPDGKFQAVS